MLRRLAALLALAFGDPLAPFQPGRSRLRPKLPPTPLPNVERLGWGHAIRAGWRP